MTSFSPTRMPHVEEEEEGERKRKLAALVGYELCSRVFVCISGCMFVESRREEKRVE